MYEIFNGECFITFNILRLYDTEVYVVIEKEGRISYRTYDLYESNKGSYFMYGPENTKVFIDDFE